ncbi:MAG: DNA repair protein RadC [Microscillaceae bacterium]
MLCQMKTYPEQNHLSIKQWAEDDRPREKLANLGKSVLSDAELLAILLGSGTVSLSAVQLAQQILDSAQNNLHELAKYTVADLKKFKGIGDAKAITIVSALELGRRRKEAEPPKRLKIISAQSAYELMQPYLLDLPYEEFWVIFLNKSNVVIRPEKISLGGVDGTVVDPKLVFKRALELLAVNLILVHNHPSGNLNPSEADQRITQKLREGGKLLDINILDHLIFTNTGYLSFADEGLI